MVTSLMILLALFNGLLIVTNRVLNARLGLHISGAGAAFWNHLVGFLFLALMMLFFTEDGGNNFSGIPFYLFLGGLIGAGYVAINSFVMPRVGATKATVLVIAGQIVIGTMIDVANDKISNLTMTIVGITLVVLGMWVGHKKVNDPAAPEPQKRSITNPPTPDRPDS